MLQFSTFQTPFDNYLYIPFESFHPCSNKKAFSKGDLIKYARNSSSFKPFSENREKIWKRLRVMEYFFSLQELFFTSTASAGFIFGVKPPAFSGLGGGGRGGGGKFYVAILILTLATI